MNMLGEKGLFIKTIVKEDLPDKRSLDRLRLILVEPT